MKKKKGKKKLTSKGKKEFKKEKRKEQEYPAEIIHGSQSLKYLWSGPV